MWPVAVKQRADVIEPLKSLPCKSAIIVSDLLFLKLSNCFTDSVSFPQPRQPPQLHISGIATSLHLVVQHPNVELDITSDVDSIAHKYLTQLLVDDGSEQPEVECLGVPNEVRNFFIFLKNCTLCYIGTHLDVYNKILIVQIKSASIEYRYL